jgi:hypothetical protein
VLKKKLCGNSSELQYLSVQPCDRVGESRWVMSRGLLAGLLRAQLGPGENIFSGPPSKGRQGKNLYTESERLTLICRVTWARLERVNLNY